ncbi:hypothetical protein GCM10022226_24360 [Sphaerisporangium flaviroseum]|uniref:Uncharacterized protein n=1 Tax=Sphaerisporangium flaviroseum TaxID=509199 RepID=A0ABP7I186_9ACTN
MKAIPIPPKMNTKGTAFPTSAAGAEPFSDNASVGAMTPNPRAAAPQNRNDRCRPAMNVLQKKGLWRAQLARWSSSDLRPVKS